VSDAVRRIVVVGGGPAGVWAAIEAKRTDPPAEVILVSEETCEPYEKPPLSKAVLLGKSQAEDAPIAGPQGVGGHNVTVRRGVRCTAIDCARRQVITIDGPIAYDALVIATGAVMRELAVLPYGQPRVHYLRSEADARAMRSALSASRRLVVVGAGLIGLEVAASAAQIGLDVTVVESAPRIMARACDADTAEIILAEHRARGVRFEMSNSVTSAVRQPDGFLVLEMADGKRLAADLVVVGIGVVPDDALAAKAGLTVKDGIIVDAYCRTSDPSIFAAGDVARIAAPNGTADLDRTLRLENWRHAQDHGLIAGRNAAGGGDRYNVLPSFWSEQYDLYIQGVGWPDGSAARVRRPLAGKSSLLLETKGGMITCALAVNAQRELATVRRLIERKVAVDIGELADPAKPFSAMLRGAGGALV
jgi:3-phenylpropionate/trans-cinnamate dioxygenase ferredoxin reductase component